MALARSPLQTEMSRLLTTFFDTPTTGAAGRAQRRWVPAMDLVEAEDAFVLRADLPGLDESDITVEVSDGVLTVAGERSEKHEVAERGFYRIERSQGQFSRSLTLPDGIDASAVAASFDKGVLEIRIPKPEERKPHRVQIAVGDAPRTIDAPDAA